MDYLWTPWRYNYVTKAETRIDCVFCTAGSPAEYPDDRGRENQTRENHDRENLIVHRASRNFVILNRFPYTNGHVMVVPYAHVSTLQDLPEDALHEMMRLAQDAEKQLRAIYSPDGINIGMNIGHSAGAGIASHIHMHVLPRWQGDTNFMTVTGETRVLPEILNVTWERLREAKWAVR
jgi:ATP adenylyltransferase